MFKSNLRENEAKQKQSERQQDIDAILVLSKLLEIANTADDDTKKQAEKKIQKLIDKL